MRRLLGSCALVVLAGSLLVHAHPDDPKPLDRLPRVEAPVFHANDGTPPPLAMVSNVSLESFIPISSISASAGAANDCWGYTAPSGREYAIIGVENATGFVEVTNPGSANVIGSISGPASTWRDVKIYDTYAYIVSEGGGGIQVVDMSNIDSGSVSLVNTITDGGTTASHNVAIDTDSGFLYRCGGGGGTVGLRMYDLSNPASPVFVGEWSDRYVHDAQIVTYSSGPWAGRQIAFCASGFGNGSVETGLDIVDVTNKNSPSVISRSYYSTAAYSHQLWLSKDRRYLYLNDELDESSFGTTTNTRILDVQDLANPYEVSSIPSSNPAIDHNLYVRGSMVFEANYRSGLRVFDATDPWNPVEVAFYDTFASDDGPAFNGLWSNYPYFDSGTIVGSDIEQGLFVFSLGYELSAFYPDGRPSRIDAAGDSIPVEIIENVPGALNGTPTLFYDDGSGFQSVPLTSTGGLNYTADFPATTCNGTVEFYIAMSSSSGSYTSPVGAPSTTFSVLSVGTETPVSLDEFESNSGWVVDFDGGDNATTGVWTRGNPNGTIAQPEDDFSAGGTDCWFTGQGSVGGSLGENDIDGGTTTLTSPALDLSALTNPVITYRQWYSNSQGAEPGADTFIVELSRNNGNTWTTVETRTSGAGTAGGWALKEIVVADVLNPSANMRIRFSASDLAGGSIVEAAIDDFAISDLECTVVICPEDFNADGSIDLTDLAILLSNFGKVGQSSSDGDTDGDGDIDLTDLAALLSAFGKTCS